MQAGQWLRNRVLPAALSLCLLLFPLTGIAAPGFGPPLDITTGTVYRAGSVAELKTALTAANGAGVPATLLIADGDYLLDIPVLQVNCSGLIVRSASGNRDRVLLRGPDEGPQASLHHVFLVSASNVTIADLTFGYCRCHGIQVRGEAPHNVAGLRVHNCRIINCNEQFIKGSSALDDPVGATDGVIEHCLFEFTRGWAYQYYTGGIDIHKGVNWIVRDNLFRNLRVPNDQTHIAEHAVHFWYRCPTRPQSVVVERNWIINCDRGIGFGLGSLVGGHNGGSSVIRNNFVYNNGEGAHTDVGIGLEYADHVRVENNTVHIARYWAPIEYRFAGSSNLVFRNNLVNAPIRRRDGAPPAALENNLETAEAAGFRDLTQGDLHLSANATNAIDRGLASPAFDTDIDAEKRPQGAGWDIGADEYAGGWPAASTSATAPRPPHILFAIADDWGYGHAGAYGCRWVKTPAFDRVAREGLLFSRAYTPNAKCAPSRACILTGRNSWQLGAAANHVPFFPPEYKTFFESFSEHGWFVGHTAKGWAPGVATNLVGRPRAMTGQAFNARKSTPTTSGIGPNDYAANFSDFLDAAPNDQPWCFWYGALEPHRGYEYGSGVAKGGKITTEIDRVPGCWPDCATVRNDLLDYAFEVEHFDRHLGRMLDELEQRGWLDHTLVVVTSDHGMPFPRAKGQAYEASNHVPLAMMWRNGLHNPGRTVDDRISFIDLAPTFVELAGLRWEQTGMAATPGRSLTDLFFTNRTGLVNPQRDWVLIGKERHDVGRPHDWGYPIRGLFRGDHLFLRNYEPDRWPAGNPETGYLNCDAGATKTFMLDAHRQDPADPFWALCFGKRPAIELYDLRRDPDCVDNLAGDPAYASTLQQLEQQMVRELQTQEDPRMSGQGAVFERYPYAQESHRDFYERYRRGEKIRAGWVNDSDFEPRPLD